MGLAVIGIDLGGLTHALETLEDCRTHFQAARFNHIVTTDASSWYRTDARREYEPSRRDLSNSSRIDE